MVQLGPCNQTQGWDWCSGYHYSDTTFTGFAHTHLSGTGIGDLGDIRIFPTFVSDEPMRRPLGAFHHENEQVAPGYYKVLLEPSLITAELTTTERVGYHRYTYPDGNTQERRMILDLRQGTGWDSPREASVKMTGDRTFEGYRFSAGWAPDQKLWFSGEFSQPVTRFENENPFRAVFDFGPDNGTVIEVKVALSYTGCQAARMALESELPDWHFDKTRMAARQAWNEQLGRVDFYATDTAVMKTFYTALYHTMLAPTLFKDVDGSYRGADGQTHKAQDFTPYTVFSLWDTYRAAHPLYTLVNPERINDFVKSFLAIYEQQGKLPVWHLVGNETDCMVGYHAVPVIVDAYLKGFRDYDVQLAYKACKDHAMRDDFGLQWVKERGYIPADKHLASVAKSLEYAIDDAAIARFAQALKEATGSTEYDSDIALFTERSKYYKNYFDASTGFMRPKMDDGSWRTPFDPFYSLHNQDDYTEGNAWQYTWLVPHDVPGLMALYPSREAFLEKLDSLFLVPSALGEGASADITGLIGQYAHGNEPSHSTLYIYAAAGEPDKTAEKVRQVLNEFYSATPEGLIGNEDCGQMSAWYVFSALGFYPMDASSGQYWFGSPIMEHATLQLPEGKQFEVVVHNQAQDAIYIEKVQLNGQDYTLPYILHSDIVKGGVMELWMTRARSNSSGTSIPMP